LIKVEHVTRSYGDFKAVDDVSFEIGRGEILGLLGHNGAGKTTVMKMLTGFLEPDAGSIAIDGLDIRSRRREAQQRIGYLPENCPLYPEMTVIDYLEYEAGLHGVSDGERLARVRSAIERTELGPKAAELISTLSRGYRQRVGVAQAILHRPRILILDEPTNGLDPSQILHMRDLIRTLAEQATVILSTHILQEVQAVCERVLILRNGALALDARLAELGRARRLLVTLDSPPEQALPLLSGIAGIEGAEHLDTDRDRRRYALTLGAGSDDPASLAPAVVRTLLDAGHALYGLEPEHHDLEAVFGEINAVNPGEVRHA
jgi:ABC-2 type transport system ATP-binding protein